MNPPDLPTFTNAGIFLLAACALLPALWAWLTHVDPDETPDNEGDPNVFG